LINTNTKEIVTHVHK
ncbi:hypothetical protein CPC698_0932B, partial [Chlamydia psittaci C6/98]